MSEDKNLPAKGEIIRKVIVSLYTYPGSEPYGNKIAHEYEVINVTEKSLVLKSLEDGTRRNLAHYDYQRLDLNLARATMWTKMEVRVAYAYLITEMQDNISKERDKLDIMEKLINQLIAGK
jgi:hypothetical protein